jgi:hypothetical protein
MKILFFISALLSLAVPVIAQQPSDDPTSQIAKLRHDYLGSLYDLLRTAKEKNNADAEKTVTEDINNVLKISSITPAIGDLAPCKTWVWQHSSMLVTLHPDFTVSKNGILANAIWHWVDEPNRKLQMHWGNWVDDATIADDGQTMDIANNQGQTYTVHVLPLDPPQDTGSAAGAAANVPANPFVEAVPCGTWVWHGGVSKVTLNSDGTVTQDSDRTRAIWHWTDEVNRKLRVSWISGWVDDLTVAEDDQTMDAINNDGTTFTVNRVPKDSPDATPPPTQLPTPPGQPSQ